MFQDGMGDLRRSESTLMAISITGAILVHSILLLVMLVAKLLGFDPSATFGDPDSGGAPNRSIVPARLVRLGEEPEPKTMPDRIVPALSTAPDDGTPVAQKIDQPEPKIKRAKRPLNPIDDDALREIFNRNRAFAEVTDHYTTTGHPSGVPGGDVADPALAQAGSLWMRKVAQVIKAYVTFPTIIPQDKLKQLRCNVKVKVGRDLIPREAKLAKRGTSRNKFYDQSVLDSFEQMRLKRVKLPRPPSELENALFGPGLVVNIYGRDLD